MYAYRTHPSVSPEASYRIGGGLYANQTESEGGEDGLLFRPLAY